VYLRVFTLKKGERKSSVCMCMWNNECPSQSMHVNEEARDNRSGGFKFAENERERERERVCMASGGQVQVSEHSGAKACLRALNACAYFPSALLQKREPWPIIVKPQARVHTHIYKPKTLQAHPSSIL
jgi:hypothetical protein